jgi:hypothetical protein
MEGRKEGRRKEGRLIRKKVGKQKRGDPAGTKLLTFPLIWRSPSTGTFSASARALNRDDFPPPFMPER